MNEKLSKAIINNSRIIGVKTSSLFRIGVSSIANNLSKLQRNVDQFFEITEVKQAQGIVAAAENKFLDARKASFDAEKELEDKRAALREARKKLDRCSRQDVNFLTFVAEEHAVVIEEERLGKMHERKEQIERDLFTEYSNAVRVSHEKERERAQNTKYWSIIGSISGTIVGLYSRLFLKRHCYLVCKKFEAHLLRAYYT